MNLSSLPIPPQGSAVSVTPRSALDQYRQYRPASNRYPSATTVQPGQTQQISIVLSCCFYCCCCCCTYLTLLLRSPLLAQVPFRGFHSRLYLTSSCFNYPYLRYCSDYLPTPPITDQGTVLCIHCLSTLPHPGRLDTSNSRTPD